MKILPLFNYQAFASLRFLPLFMLAMIAGLTVNTLSAQDLSRNAQLQLKSLLEEKASRTKDQRKINAQILYAYKMDSGRRIAPEVPTLRTGVIKDARGLIKTEMTVEVNHQLIRSLVQQGCEIIQTHEKYSKIIAMIPLANVELIAELREIQYINLWVDPTLNSNFSNERLNKKSEEEIGKKAASPENTKANKDKSMDFRSKSERRVSEKLNTVLSNGFIGAVTSNGDAKHQANLLRLNNDVDGSGIKIGVLSNSYDTRATGPDAIDDVLSGDLPGVGNPNGYTMPVTVLSDYSGAVNSPSADEGRAMLQIIHDIAPRAELYFALGFNGELDFAQQVLDLQAAGCDIIVDDVAYFGEIVWGGWSY